MLVRRLEGVEKADRFKRLAGEKAGFSMSFQRDATVRDMQESAGSKYRTGREKGRRDGSVESMTAGALSACLSQASSGCRRWK